MDSGLPLQAAAPARGILFRCELWASLELLICKQDQLITAGNLSSCKAGRQHDCCGVQAQTWLRTGAEQEGSPRATPSSTLERCLDDVVDLGRTQGVLVDTLRLAGAPSLVLGVNQVAAQPCPNASR